MDFETRSKIVFTEEDYEEDGCAPILHGEMMGDLMDISIKKTLDTEKAKYKCKLVVDHLVKNGVKLADLEIIDAGSRVIVRKKKKTE